jgi:hypothetical protein
VRASAVGFGHGLDLAAVRRLRVLTPIDDRAVGVGDATGRLRMR